MSSSVVLEATVTVASGTQLAIKPVNTTRHKALSALVVLAANQTIVPTPVGYS